MSVTVYILAVLLPLNLAASASQIDPLLYVRYCKHDFSSGCPIYGQTSWDCAKTLTNCSSPNDTYHCILNSYGKVVHICAEAKICQKGTIPIYDPWKHEVSCEKCPEGHYQPRNIRSDRISVCLKKSDCDIGYHKIKCPVAPEEEYSQDTLCRCDARHGYILSNSESRDTCVLVKYANCYESKCPDGQERLILDYSCVSICEEGFQRYDSDICMPKSTVIPMTLGVTEKASPTSTASSENSSKGNSSGDIDTDIYPLIAIIVTAVFIAVIVLIVVVAWWKWKHYRNRHNVQRQSSGDQTRSNDMELQPFSQVQTGDSELQTTSHGISRSILIKLAEDLIPDEMKFFFRNFQVSENELEEVEINYRRVKEQRYQVLLLLNRKGSLNMTNIIQGFEEMGRKDLAHKYREMHCLD